MERIVLEGPSSALVRQANKSHKTKVYGCILAHSGCSLLVALLLMQQPFERAGIQTVAIMSISLSVFLGIFVAKSLKDGVWSFPFLYFLILSLFHLGLYIAPALDSGQMATFLESMWSGWYNDNIMIRAAYIIDLGLLSYASAIGVVSWTTRESQASNKFGLPSQSESDGRMRDSIVDVGGLILSISFLNWLVLCVSQLGPMFFLSSYSEYRSATEGESAGLIYFGITIGSALIAQNFSRPLPKVALICLISYFVLALPIGLRSESLFPLAAALAVYVRCHKTPSSASLVAAVLLGLLAISAVQQVRSEGLGDTSLREVSASPLKAVEEMGYTARVLVTSIGWHEAAHEPYLEGATYAAPLERGLTGLLGLPRVDAESDFRLMNVEIAARVGTIGGSIIAEAHHNFGQWGAIIVLALAGTLASRLSTLSPRPLSVALLGVTAALMLMHVRNSFAPIFAWGTGGLLLIALAVGTTWLRGRWVR